MSNTWVICPRVWNNSAKAELIPDKANLERELDKAEAFFGSFVPKDEPAAHQLVGGVMAHQG